LTRKFYGFFTMFAMIRRAKTYTIQLSKSRHIFQKKVGR